MDLLTLLRTICKDHVLSPSAIFRPTGAGKIKWPLTIKDEVALEKALRDGGHFLPLPTEPAALANVLEQSIISFLLERLPQVPGITARKGTERGYPDVEIEQNGKYYALDVKVAKRQSTKTKPATRTQSRITLYTGNTYFAYPERRWPGTFRPFAEYSSHLDLIALYTFNEETLSHVEDLQILVHEPWTIASKKRSSTTREYIGAVMSLADLEAGCGEFKTEKAFYDYWRGFNFKVGNAVKIQLRKMLKESAGIK